MKNTRRCPKCSSGKIYRLERTGHGAVLTGMTALSYVPV